VSMMIHIHALDPRTRRDIEARNFQCGCQQAPLPESRWSICDYHDGFDSALDLHASTPENTACPTCKGTGLSVPNWLTPQTHCPDCKGTGYPSVTPYETAIKRSKTNKSTDDSYPSATDEP
jgi:DnaJ-class molecular chaperone